jgi:hypothetical protein
LSDDEIKVAKAEFEGAMYIIGWVSESEKFVAALEGT